MERITIDDAAGSQLGACSVIAEICDRSGRKLGHFVPASVPPGAEECPYSEEELARMRHEQGGRTLPEIWKSLGNA